MEQTDLQAVVVVQVPACTAEQAEAIRQAALRAIAQGVWVIPDTWSWTLAKLPCRVEASGEPQPGKQGRTAPDKVALKKATHARLLAYRKDHGLGCLEAVAKAARRKGVTADVLRRVISEADELGDDQWAAVARALDRLGKEGVPGGTGTDVENP